MELDTAIRVLQQKGSLLYPSDTVLGLGCDATDDDAVQKIFQIKKRPSGKALIALVADMQMLSEYVDVIPDAAKKIIKTSKQPTTIIYQKVQNIATSAIAKDGSMAFRIPQPGFALDLVQSFGKPIISTSANLSGAPIPAILSAVDPQLLTQVDYVVPLCSEMNNTQPSKLVLLKPNGDTQILRT